MKVFALGGYGKVGMAAVRLLTGSEEVTEVAIAGRNTAQAKKAAAAIGEKAVVVDADGTHEHILTPQLDKYDIIMNTAPNETVLPCIKAAMKAGAHYCDVAFGGVVRKALELTSEAETAGITAITDNGVHPGISNLMGMHVAEQLDEVKQLQIGDASIYNFKDGRELTPEIFCSDSKNSLAELHNCRSCIALLLQVAKEKGGNTACTYRDGRWVDVDPVTAGIEVRSSEGERITAYPFGTSDPLFRSIPLDRSVVQPLEMYFSPLPPKLHELLREKSLQVTGGHVEVETAVSSFFDTIESDPPRWPAPSDSQPQVPKTWVRAVGHKAGRPAHFDCRQTDVAWEVGGYLLTSAALVVAVLRILRGEMKNRGVMVAERAFEPRSFLDEVESILRNATGNNKLFDENFEWLA